MSQQPYYYRAVEPEEEEAIYREVRRLRAQSNPLRLIGIALVIGLGAAAGLGGISGLAIICRYMGW